MSSPSRQGRPWGRKTRSKPEPEPSALDHDEHPLDAADEPGPRREAVAGELDRRGEDVRPREASKPLVGVAPRPNGTRNGDRERPSQRQGVHPLVAERRRICGRRRPSRSVQGVLAAGRRFPHEPERVAADPAARRHDDREDRVRRDGRVDRAAARAQDREPRLGREMVGRDDRAVAATGEHRRDEDRVAGHSAPSVRVAGDSGPPT